MLNLFLRGLVLTVLLLTWIPHEAAGQISGIRLTQTGNTGLMINVDVSAFYTTGSTETTAYLGTYYNQVPAIDWGDGSTTPRYGYGPSTGIPLVATSTVVNGIPARAYRGSFSHSYGSAGSYTISANTRCCPIATPTNTLVSGTIVTTTITTSGPFGPTTFTTSFVQNTLAVNAVAPGFGKAFAPSSVGIGAPSTLTFTIDNTAGTLDDNNLAFVDNLPAGLLVASPANVATSCTGGTVTATSGTGTISYSGGTVAAGAGCTLSVDVSADLPGAYANTTGDLTSAFGNSGTASDTLTVTAVPVGFTKSFNPDNTGIDVPSTLTFSIDNAANAATVSSLDFTDNLPAGMTISNPANVVNSCTGGTLTATSGAAVISYTGGSVGAAGSCAISVDVQADSIGAFVNTTGDLTSTSGNSGTASDTLNVGAAPLFTKAFSPDAISIGEVSTLTFTIDNSAGIADATGLAFVDNLPAGVEVASPENIAESCTGGTVTAVAGTSVITYSGGSVSMGATCMISVDVTVTDSGQFVNVADPLSSSLGTSPAGSATAPLSGGTVLDVPTASTRGLLGFTALLALFAVLAMRRKL